MHEGSWQERDWPIVQHKAVMKTPENYVYGEICLWSVRKTLQKLECNNYDREIAIQCQRCANDRPPIYIVCTCCQRARGILQKHSIAKSYVIFYYILLILNNNGVFQFDSSSRSRDTLRGTLKS